MQAILDRSLVDKKAADLLFVRKEYAGAISTYEKALKTLEPIEGFSSADMIRLRSYSSIAACHLKLSQFKETVLICDKAASIPNAVADYQLLTKVYERSASAHESLGDYERALSSLDKCIAIDLHFASLKPSAEQTEAGAGAAVAQAEHRRKLCNLILNKNDDSSGIVAIPPPPEAITQAQVENVIRSVLTNQGDSRNAEMMNLVRSFVETRGFVDARDGNGNSVMWAVCQCAIIRAAYTKAQVEKAVSSAVESGGKTQEEIEEVAAEAEAAAAPEAVLPILQLLLSAGASVSQRAAKDGKTLFQFLCLAGASQSVHLFLEMGADPNIYDNMSWGPLHVACAINSPARGRNYFVVDLLLTAGARVNQANAEGMSPLALAAQSGDGNLCLLLVKKGASVNARCKMGYTPTVWALIGSDGADNSVLQVLIGLAKGHVQVQKTQGKESTLLLEMEQERNCFAFARHVAMLRGIATRGVGPRSAADAGAASADAAAAVVRTPEEISKLCVLAMLASMGIGADLVSFGLLEKAEAAKALTSTGADASEGVNVVPQFTDANPLFVAYSRWGAITPWACTKKYMPAPSVEAAIRGDFEVTLAGLSPTERSWLHILNTTLNPPREGVSLPPMLVVINSEGGGNQASPAAGESSVKEAEASASYCVSRIAHDFSTFCAAPLSIQFCTVIPNDEAVKTILATTAATTAAATAAATGPTHAGAVQLFPLDISVGGKHIQSADPTLSKVVQYWNEVLKQTRKLQQLKAGNASEPAVVEVEDGAGDSAESCGARAIPVLRLYSGREDLAGPNKQVVNSTMAALNALTSPVAAAHLIVLIDDIDSNSRRIELLESLCQSHNMTETCRMGLPAFPFEVQTTFVMLTRK